MARRDPVKEALARLRRLDYRSQQGQAALAEALSHPSSFVVARAANYIMEAGLHQLAADIEKTLERFLGQVEDKGCEAKIALTRALCELDIASEALFARGIRVVQKERAFPAPVDTAAELRGLCGIGLVRSSRPQVLDDLAELLADPEPAARALAARAVGESGELAGTALLRLLLLSGEQHSEVVLECLSAMLSLDLEGSLPFIRRHYPAGDPLFPVVALCLGETRRPEALEALQEYRLGCAPNERKALFEAIALTRLPQALDLLLQVVKEDPQRAADEAAQVIARYFTDRETAGRLKLAQVERRGLGSG